MAHGDLNVASWRERFPVTKQYVYLDHAGVGPMPAVAAEAGAASLKAQSQSGSLIHASLHQSAETVRRQFAAFIGAAPESIAAVGSTSAGVSVVAAGLDWRDGDNVVVLDTDFPSIIFPWMTLQARGVEIRRVAADQNGCIPIAMLLQAASARTRVVAVSWVQFSTGYRLDIAALGGACRRRGILLVVDAMQAVGALQIDVAALPIDALATQSYKWLLAPQGVGWLYLDKRLLDQLRPVAAGPRSVTPRDSFLDYRFEPRRDAQRIETGILNFHGLVAAGASLKLLAEVGADAIERRLSVLTGQLVDGLRGIGCRVLGSPDDPGRRSGIIVFVHPRLDPAACHKLLLDAAIVTSLRGPGIRVSPHFYNTPEEIDFVIETLAR